jgi:tRNA U34 5-methylaminomethyl-2-thiouridine-forming methyltransferase MnmC
VTRRIIVTGDGSHTIEAAPGLTFHSTYGAIQESMHVFIAAGLAPLLKAHTTDPIRIFELGLGTGLNALLTLSQSNRPIHYEAVEPFPLDMAIIQDLNYHTQPSLAKYQPAFEAIHTAPWNAATPITPAFTLLKSQSPWPAYRLSQPADLVYYDAFDPVAQPELWDANAFAPLFAQMTPHAVLVTYCSKGMVRRTLQQTGFLVKKIPGPPGKREMLHASKPGM